jgi:PAS domain S-box-containing protein
LIASSPANQAPAAAIITISGLLFVLLGYLRDHLGSHRSKKERHFRLLADRNVHPIILKDKNRKILYASSTIKDLIGVKPATLLSQDFLNFIYSQDRIKFKRDFKKLSRTPAKRQSFEIRMKNQTGEWFWFRSDTINLIDDPDVSAIVSSFQDISRQKYLDDQRSKILSREKKARALAEKAVQTRDEFLSVASHELKTPLTTVLLQLQGTLRRILTQSLADFSGEKLVASLNIAEQQSQRLSLMIKDLLNVSLVSTGRISIKKQSVDLSKLTKSVIDRFKDQTNQKDLKIKATLDNHIVGQWDPIRIEQVVVNLLTNAVKYGDKKPIEVTVGTTKSFAFVSVKDLGLGISLKDKKRLFHLFHRGSNNNKKGLGVGLFISKKIAQSHNGDLKVTSKPKKGSTFTLLLPLKNS